MGLQPFLASSSNLYNEPCYVEIMEGVYPQVTSRPHVSLHKYPFPSPSLGFKTTSRGSVELRTWLRSLSGGLMRIIGDFLYDWQCRERGRSLSVAVAGRLQLGVCTEQPQKPKSSWRLESKSSTLNGLVPVHAL